MRRMPCLTLVEHDFDVINNLVWLRKHPFPSHLNIRNIEVKLSSVKDLVFLTAYSVKIGYLFDFVNSYEELKLVDHKISKNPSPGKKKIPYDSKYSH